MSNTRPLQGASTSRTNPYNGDHYSQSLEQTRPAYAELNFPVPPRYPSGSVHRATVYAYYIDRGNGQYTRLLPTDTLPPMDDVSPREARHDNMVILPPLPATPGQERHGQHASQHGEPLPSTCGPSRQEIFCDKWIHEGVCAFTQRGCRFKHEMPSDTATQWSLGLFHGYPPWWRKRLDGWNSLEEIGRPSRRRHDMADGHAREPERGQGGALGVSTSGRGSDGPGQHHGRESGIRVQRDLVPFAWNSRGKGTVER